MTVSWGGLWPGSHRTPGNAGTRLQRAGPGVPFPQVLRLPRLTHRHKSPVAGFGLGTAAASAPAPEKHALSVQTHPRVSAQEEEPGFVNPMTLT